PRQPGPQRQLAHRGGRAQPPAAGARAPFGPGVPGASGSGTGGGARAAPARRSGMTMKVVVVTGVSGAGKSTALRALEDLGFYCVDNLPLPLLGRFVALLEEAGESDRAALVVDAREGGFLKV